MTGDYDRAMFLSLESVSVRYARAAAARPAVEAATLGLRKGQIGVLAPHSYNGELEAALSDVAVWLRPFPALGGGLVAGGALNLKWSGDGSLEGHSGLFDLGLCTGAGGTTPVEQGQG